jgi:hypothetical protein
MRTCWIAFLLMVMLQASGQQAPWTGLPSQKKALDANMQETTIYLCLDTLYKYDNWDPQEQTGKLLYSDSVDLAGYGYKDKAGRPYGLWKYYTRSTGGYELYSEGYYTTMQPQYLWVEEDIDRRFATASDVATKTDFINSLNDPLLFTGEWRFYRQGHLDKILVLDNRVRMPYALSEEEGGVTSLLIALPQRRLTGTAVSRASFASTGYLKSISGYSIDFDSTGKPIIHSLPDLDFPL